MGRGRIFGWMAGIIMACGVQAAASADVTLDSLLSRNSAEWRAARVLTERVFKWAHHVTDAGGARSDSAARVALVQLVAAPEAPRGAEPSARSNELVAMIEMPAAAVGDNPAGVVLDGARTARTELVKESLAGVGQGAPLVAVGPRIQSLPWARTYVVARQVPYVAGGWSYDLKTTDAGQVAVSSVGGGRR